MLSVIKSYVNHKAVLRKRGLSSIAVEGAYLYPKTAGPEPTHGEDVFAGYGEENRGRLREISRRYDPDQVFQVLQPGYFKL